MRGLQEVVAVDALGAADDFAVALGGEDVDAEGLGGVGGVGLHVEGLDGGGVAVDHDGLVELGGDVGLVGGAEVVAVLVGGLDLALGEGVVEHGVGLVVGEAGKGVARGSPALGSLRFAQDEGWAVGSLGGYDLFEFGDVAADDFEVGAVVVEDAARRCG